MTSPKFVCTQLSEEVAILSDGRITTCCLDARGENTFANIYEDDLESSIKKFQDFKERLVNHIEDFRVCVGCIRNHRNYTTRFHIFNPPEEEIEDYIYSGTMPTRLVIELTTACNMSCIGCISGQREISHYRKPDKGQFLDVEKLKKWLEFYLNLNAVRVYNYGETFLHPQVIYFCSFLTKHFPGIHVGIATNLLPLNTPGKISALVKAQPNVLWVSLHGANQESIKKYMGSPANFNQAIKLMKAVIHERTRLELDFPRVIWKYLLFMWNDSTEEMEKAAELFKKHKIDGLGFELATGPFASKKYAMGSKNFEALQRSEFYIQNVANQFKSLKLKRKEVQ